MKIIIAPDSFKGSLTSAEVSRILSDAAARIFGAECELRTLQIADGGEGTLSALLENLPDAHLVAKTTVGPLGIPVQARYLRCGKVAFVEMAEASGLTLVPDTERNPLRTTTYGTGELIRDAIQNGCRDIYIAIGGSATNDCGIGAMQALGFGFEGVSGISGSTAVGPHIACATTSKICTAVSETCTAMQENRGGAIENRSAEVRNCFAEDDRGGAIENPSAEVRNCFAEDNCGDAIEIRSAKVKNCSAEDDRGGAIENRSAKVRICSAEDDRGGAIENRSAEVRICSAEDNRGGGSTAVGNLSMGSECPEEKGAPQNRGGSIENRSAEVRNCSAEDNRGGESTAVENLSRESECSEETGAPRYLVGADLIDVTAIDDSKAMPEIKECRFHVMCDVQNPLTGPQGATYTYGSQKCSSHYSGVERQMILDELEAGMLSFSKVLAAFQAGERVTACAETGVSEVKDGSAAAEPPVKYGRGTTGDVAAQAEERVTACAETGVSEVKDGSTTAEPPVQDSRGTTGDVAAQAEERVTACAETGVSEVKDGSAAAEPPVQDSRGTTEDVAAQAGYGAAGGLGAALSIFLEAELRSGVDMVLELCGFDEMVRAADAVVSGEGCTDEQTLHGKVIYGIGKKCLANNVPLWVLSGRVNCETCVLAEIGVSRAFQATNEAIPVTDAMEHAEVYLSAAAESMFLEMRRQEVDALAGDL